MIDRVIRSAVIVIVIALLVYTYRISIQTIPRIDCDKLDVEEGNTVHCAAGMDYPPDQPRFEWIVDGECLPESSSEQTIRLTTLAPSQNHACQLHLRVYDSSTNRMAGEKSALISITKTAAVRSVTPPDVPPVLVSVPPDKQASRAMLLVDAWPVIDPRADGAPIEGKVKGVEFKRHRVALYTWTGDGWSLQDMKPIDQTTGGWSGVAKFGSSYAALLVTDSFTPEPKLKKLPEVGGAIVRLQKSN